MRAASLDWRAQALAALAQFDGGRTQESRMAALNKLELLFKGDDYQKRVLRKCLALATRAKRLAALSA
jgi:hypothetical protein